MRAARDARRALVCAALACGAIGAWAPVAGAATVAYDPRVSPAVTYTAVDGEPNRLRVGGAGTLVQFSDPAGITAPDPDPPAVNLCNAAGSGAACPAAASIAVDLGDLDDTVATATGAPAMTVVGGTGGDALLDPVRSQGTKFDGGDGSDRADYSGRTERVSVSLSGNADDGVTGEADDISGVEDVVGGSGDDALAGDLGANGLTGGPGADTLDGGDGNDQLIGGADGDSLAGGPGADRISAVDGVADTIDCGAGADTVDADRGAGGVTDVIVNCETVTGPVAGVAAASGLAAPRLATVRAPGRANPADLTPPRATLRAAIRQKMRTVRARGVELRIACRESCGVSAALAIERPAARRLRLAGRTGGAVLGTAKARRSTAGALRVRVRLSRRARTALRRARSLRVTAQVLVSDASGNGTLLQRRVTLVR